MKQIHSRFSMVNSIIIFRHSSRSRSIKYKLEIQIGVGAAMLSLNAFGGMSAWW